MAVPPLRPAPSPSARRRPGDGARAVGAGRTTEPSFGRPYAKVLGRVSIGHFERFCVEHFPDSPEGLKSVETFHCRDRTSGYQQSHNLR
jgi:hypothetical protein